MDQPVGTGFSYTSDESDLRHDEDGVSNDLYDFLQVRFQYFPLFFFVKNFPLFHHIKYVLVFLKIFFFFSNMLFAFFAGIFQRTSTIREE